MSGCVAPHFSVLPHCAPEKANLQTSHWQCIGDVLSMLAGIVTFGMAMDGRDLYSTPGNIDRSVQ